MLNIDGPFFSWLTAARANSSLTKDGSQKWVVEQCRDPCERERHGVYFRLFFFAFTLFALWFVAHLRSLVQRNPRNCDVGLTSLQHRNYISCCTNKEQGGAIRQTVVTDYCMYCFGRKTITRENNISLSWIKKWLLSRLSLKESNLEN